MLKKVLIIGGALIALLCLLFFIPTTYSVHRSVTITAEPAAIYPYLNNLQRWQEWSAWTKETYPTMEYKYEGPEEGVGSTSMWTVDGDDGKMVITKSDPAVGVHYDLAFSGGTMKSKGGITFEAAEGGTKVTWQNGGDAGLLFKPFIDNMIAPDFEKGLNKLKTIVESAPAMPADTATVD